MGWSLHGLGTANDGILVTKVGFLRLYNILIENFANDGVEFTTGTSLAIYDSQFVDNANDGILVGAAASTAYMNRCEFDNNFSAGIEATVGNTTVADSAAHHNGTGFYANDGTLVLDYELAAVGVVPPNGTGAWCTVADIDQLSSGIKVSNQWPWDFIGGPSGTNAFTWDFDDFTVWVDNAPTP